MFSPRVLNLTQPTVQRSSEWVTFLKTGCAHDLFPRFPLGNKICLAASVLNEGAVMFEAKSKGEKPNWMNQRIIESGDVSLFSRKVTSPIA
jgi:hypothetical protein